ncbi:MAG: SRPBCC family protein [Pseudomonadota bacterium]
MAKDNTIRIHRVFAASPEKVYRALTDADAMTKWLAPNGFTCHVDSMDVKVGGTYKMSFTNFTTGKQYGFSGVYKELVPNERMRYIDKFDDPNMPGEMPVTITLKAVSVGTDFTVVQENLPDIMPVEGCYQGWQDTMNNLARLVEPDIKDD